MLSPSPSPVPFGSAYGADGGKGKGKALPEEPDEAALPLRSRSPGGLSPRQRHASTGVAGENPFADTGNGGPSPGREARNPFESEYDETRLSPETNRRVLSSGLGLDARGRDDSSAVDRRDDSSAVDPDS